MKTFASLMAGAALLSAVPVLATPAFAENSATIVQFGDVNTVRGDQDGRRNRLQLVQQGRDNWTNARQRGVRNHAEIGQDGRYNRADFYQYQYPFRRR